MDEQWSEEHLQARLRYWKAQLARSAIDDDLERAKLCERWIAEYTRLLKQLRRDAPPGPPGVLDRE